MSRGIVLDFDFSSAQTLSDFFHSDEFVRIVVGPVGSSKTTAFCCEIMKRAMEQEPSPIDNVRYFKAAVVRNTMPELWRTTIETWLAVFREDQCGPMRRSSPVHHHIKIPPNQVTGEPGLDLLVDFFAMDKPDNVRALLSYEGTLIWFNEVREIPRNIVKAATDRAGRYPSRAKNSVMPTWFGVMGDTNPPDEEHWIYEFYAEPPEYYKVFKQPPGVFECVEKEKEDGSKYWQSIDARGPDVKTSDPNNMQVSAGKMWLANPKAENLVNLPIFKEGAHFLSKDGYYLFRVSGKDYDWIRGYYQGDFGPVFDGKPVIPEFNREIMVSDQIQILEGVPLGGGFDIGGGTLNSAAVFGQKHPRGPYMIFAEVNPDEDGMGLVRFGEEVNYSLAEYFPTNETHLGRFWGDPAGRTRDPLFETTVFDHLHMLGLPVFEAPSNNPQLRVEAIKSPMGRMVDGSPGIIIHPRCKNLIKGLLGGWSYKRVQTSSAERYRDVPDKSRYSHICDALGYYLLGSGEGNALRGRTTTKQTRNFQAKTSFNIFSG